MTRVVKKVHGPYMRKDNRQHVVIVYTDDTKRTVSYPKYLMEQHLGRELDPKLETIDHIDKNPLNNDLSNLQVLTLSEHAELDAKCYRYHELTLTCVQCNLIFTRTTRNVRSNANKKRAGPFCSSKCSGLYGSNVQKGCQEPLAIQKYSATEYTTKKQLRQEANQKQ